MSADDISVIDVSKEIGKRKQTVFKVIRRLGIETKKLRASEAHGQLISYISKDDFSDIKNELETESDTSLPNTQNSEFGVFYLIQLEPEHDPCRIKLGFATNINERLRSHRCSAPFAKVISTWPCKLLWEKTVIECATINCEKLHTEVFRSESIEAVKNRCNEIFTLLPNLNDDEV